MIILIMIENSSYAFFLDFSLTTWLSSTGHPDTTPLTGVVLQNLMEHLQLSRFKADNCDQTSAPYVPRDSNGWNSSKNS